MAVCQHCGDPVEVEVEFDTGYEAPVRLYFECSGCCSSGRLEGEGFGQNLGELFG